MKTATSLSLRLIYSLLLAAAPFTALAQATFTKIRTGPVVNNAANSLGVAWVDFDNNGSLDLYVSANQDAGNLLYRNDGNGMFTQLTTGPLVNAGAGSFSTSWADLDNDGRIDVFIGRRPGPGLLFRQQADGTFIRSTLATGSCLGVAWADYDNDGFVDLLVADGAQNILWHNDGKGGLVAVRSTPIVTAPDATAIAWADYNNDGHIDVFVATVGAGNSRLYRNDGRGAFTQITSGQLAQRSTFVSAAAWGDYDNDGFPDLFLARGTFDSSQPLPSFLFHNNGDGTFTQVETSPFTDDMGAGAPGCAWGDFDNDGWLDLIVTAFGGPNRLYHNNGDGTFSRVLSGSIATDIGNSSPCAWGDYDRDGFLDLFIANSTSGGGDSNDFLYHNDGNSNAWITVKCVGTVSNRSAIGAKVRVKATIGGKTFWQLREINTGDGWDGNPLEAHFGLGGATNIETLRIEWPSATVQEFQNVAAKQFLTVIEPAHLLVTTSNGIPQFSLQGGRGLQYEVQTSTDLAAWSVLSTLTITNSSGTIVITDTNALTSDRRFHRAVLR